MEHSKSANGEYYSMNRNVDAIKILPNDTYKPEFVFLGRQIHGDVETEIICENGNLGFDCQVVMKNGTGLLFRNVTGIHWGIDGKGQFSLESNFIQEQNVYQFRSVKRLEIMKSPEMHPLITSKLNS
jgi:hypothetical protein